MINLFMYLQQNLNLELLTGESCENILDSQKKLIDFYKYLEESLFNPVIINKENLKHNLNNCNQTQPMNQFCENYNESIENLDMKEKYLSALQTGNHQRHFQVYYVFRNKIKRMYRVDCMTRKINV
jgi:hypothetical protein